MKPMYYIGLDVHKQKISYCVKEGGGRICAEGWIPATRHRKSPQDLWSAAPAVPWVEWATRLSARARGSVRSSDNG